MLNLDTHISLDTILQSPNVATHLTEQQRADIGANVCELFEMDRNSRSGWEQRMEKSSKLALQVQEKKTFPWPDASNVKFPLITIAALQYHSRVYPALVTTPDLVRYVAVGEDPESVKSAERVSQHMSWQLMEEDENWEAEEDVTLLVQALMGTAFKKTYFNHVLKHNVSELVLPQDLVVSYYTKSINTCPRATHILGWTHNDLQERVRRKVIFETDMSPPRVIPVAFGQLAALKDKVQGMTAQTQDPEQPFIILEQHNELDLDGDGYKEPYVCTVRYDNRQLLRIAPRFLPSGIEFEHDGGKPIIIRIKAEKFFTRRLFIPSPDGGFYGLGFGHLLGPLNESIDTSINQLFDAGTMHNAGGGFLGRGARFKSGAVSFRPNEWKRVESSGDDLRKSIVELPRREPSAVLFNLLSLLIDYGQRVAGAPDSVQGQNPGQNTPAETSRNMLEQGIKVFAGIYKRTYRAVREELKNLYRLNELYLEETQAFVSPKTGMPMKALAADYMKPDSLVRPSANATYMSEAQEVNQAIALMEAAHSNPGYDIYKANLRYLKAIKIPNPEEVLPDPKGENAIPQGPSEKIQIETIRADLKKAELAQEMKLKLFDLMEEHDLNRAMILKMEAEAAAKLEEAGVEKGQALVGAINAQIGMLKVQQEGRKAGIEILRDLLEIAKGEHKDGQGRVGGVGSKSLHEGLLLGAAKPAAELAGSVEPGSIH